MGLIPMLERSPGVANGNPLQYSRLENSMDRGAYQATVHGVTNCWTHLSMHTRTHTHTHTHIQDDFFCKGNISFSENKGQYIYNARCFPLTFSFFPSYPSFQAIYSYRPSLYSVGSSPQYQNHQKTYISLQ